MNRPLQMSEWFEINESIPIFINLNMIFSPMMTCILIYLFQTIQTFLLQHKMIRHTKIQRSIFGLFDILLNTITQTVHMKNLFNPKFAEKSFVQ